MIHYDTIKKYIKGDFLKTIESYLGKYGFHYISAEKLKEMSIYFLKKICIDENESLKNKLNYDFSYLKKKQEFNKNSEIFSLFLYKNCENIFSNAVITDMLFEYMEKSNLFEKEKMQNAQNIVKYKYAHKIELQNQLNEFMVKSNDKSMVQFWNSLSQEDKQSKLKYCLDIIFLKYNQKIKK